MDERTTVRLPKELLRRARNKAAAEGRTLTSIIEDGVRRVVDEKPKATKSERVLPRISTATGGLLPEFVGKSFSELQELDDLEYVERMKRGFK
jgi:hypothetical protein